VLRLVGFCQPVAKTIPGFCNCRLAKGALANLANFLALSGRHNSAPPPCGANSPFSNGLSSKDNAIRYHSEIKGKTRLLSNKLNSNFVIFAGMTAKNVRNAGWRVAAWRDPLRVGGDERDPVLRFSFTF
jgi:hypothetical protein